MTICRYERSEVQERERTGERSDAIRTNGDLFPLASYYYLTYITVRSTDRKLSTAFHFYRKYKPNNVKKNKRHLNQLCQLI